MSKLNDLYEQAVAAFCPEDDSPVTREQLLLIATKWAELLIAEDDGAELIAPLLYPSVEQRLIREPARQAEQEARKPRESNRGSGRHKRAPRVAQLTFLDTQVMLKSWPEPVAWGDMSLSQVREVVADRRARFESLRQTKIFAEEQLALMESTGAATLREAYTISRRKAA